MKTRKVKNFLKNHGSTIGLASIGAIAAFCVGVSVGDARAWSEVIYMVEGHGGVALTLRDNFTGKVTSINMSLNK